MTTEQLINAIVKAAEPIRLQIIRLIARHGELCAKDILPAFDITQPTLSHHMTVLEEAGLVLARRHGRCVYYTLNRKTFTEINNLFKHVVEDGGKDADSSGSIDGKKTVKVEKSRKSVSGKSSASAKSGAKSGGAKSGTKSDKGAGAKSASAKSSGAKSDSAKSASSKVAKAPVEDPKDKKKKDKKKKDKDKKKKK